MRTPTIGILGDGIVERDVSKYYRSENFAMCTLHPREASLDWARFFREHDGMILDYHNEPESDRRLDNMILDATRKWQSRIVVLAEDYEACWAEIGANGIHPLMVVPKPSGGSTKSHGFRIVLYRAAEEIAKAGPTQPNGPPVVDPPRQPPKIAVRLLGVLLVVVGVFFVSTLPTSDEAQRNDFVRLFVAMIPTGLAMLGHPEIAKLLPKKWRSGPT